MLCYLRDHLIEIIGILLGLFIAYHVHYLSKRTTLRDRLSHRDAIRAAVAPLLSRVRHGTSKVELVNAKNYLSHYPDNAKTPAGYTFLGAEFKSLRFDGVEFFCAVKESYRTPTGDRSLSNVHGSTPEENVLEVGVIPYEWMEYVDIGGDGFSGRSQFFTHFKGQDKSPYKYHTYYVRRSDYRQDEPVNMQWKLVDIVK
jgi:hypothetical protein